MPDRDRALSRRGVLRGIGSASVSTFGLTSLAGRTAADSGSRLESKPDHVRIGFDRDYLETYQPELVTDHLDVTPKALYGWVARSEDYDTSVACYFAAYTHQNSAWYAPGDIDAHFGDHEPVQIEVDDESGDPVRVRASIYHWMKGETVAATVPMDDSGQRPRLYVFKPHHHYRAAQPDESTTAVEVDDLTAVFEDWMDDGLDENLIEGAFTNPWVMQTEPDFWAEGVGGISANALYVSALQTAGIGDLGSLTA
jgi:hypothetical protein